MPLIGIKNVLRDGELQIIPVSGLPIKNIWRLIWLKGKHRSPVAADFINYLRAEKTAIVEDKFRWHEEY
jgi:DNA-binding transcriptional LysR family regulator